MRTDKERYEKAKNTYKALMKCYPFTTDDLDGEEWQPVRGNGEHYHISTFGRLKSFWGGRAKILKPTLALDYLRVDLCDGVKAHHVVIHRLVANAFIPNPDNKPQVNHIDGNKFNNHVSNLEWVTASENGKHAFSLGLNENAKGGDDSQAKLTNEQAIWIRLNGDNFSQQQLAKNFAVSRKTIGRILADKTYKDIS